MASLAAITARRSVRDMRRALRPLTGSIASRSASTSAAMSVGKVSRGNRVSLPIPARDSRIERHTSSWLRPIEQMMPRPVTARRIDGSGLRMVGSQVKPASGDFYSFDRCRSTKAEDAAKIRFEDHMDVHAVACDDGAIDFTRIDSAHEAVPAWIEDEPAPELCHRLDEHQLGRHRLVRRPEKRSVD